MHKPYDAARRVTRIQHKGTAAPPNDMILQLVYTYPCEFGRMFYTSVRVGYAQNGQTVTFVLGEQWCSDGVSTGQYCVLGPYFHEVETDY